MQNVKTNTVTMQSYSEARFKDSEDASEAFTAEPAYLFHNIEFIRSVVKQGVEGIALCQDKTDTVTRLPTYLKKIHLSALKTYRVCQTEP